MQNTVQEPEESNKILSQNVCIGYDAKKHRRNLNTLVVGGSGAGKTRFYAKPNILQANTSFVVLDPKGENLRDTGGLLKAKGYEVKVLDLINMEQSDGYNPFRYLESDNDVQRLVTNLLRQPHPKEANLKTLFGTQRRLCCFSLLFFTSSMKPRPRSRISQW